MFNIILPKPFEIFAKSFDKQQGKLDCHSHIV